MSEELFDKERGRKGTKKKKLIILTIVMSVVALLAAIYLVYRLYIMAAGTYTNYSVEYSAKREDGLFSNYTTYHGQLLKYSRDGAQVYTTDTNLLWNGSYEMKDPIVDTCKEYAVIADRGGKQLYIYNTKGVAQSITVEYPILKAEVAAQGVVAVLMEAKEANYIRLYSLSGKVLFDKETSVEREGYPLDFAISNDGQKMVLAYMDISSAKVKMNVSYYNLGDVGQNYNNRLVLGTIYEDTIIPRVEFIGNNTVCIYKEQGIEMYSMEEIPDKEPVVKVDFTEEIISTFSNSSYVGFVLKGKKDGEKYRVIVYNTKGRKILDQSLEFDYTAINMYGSDIIFYNNTDCYILQTNGHLKFEYTFKENISALIGSSNKNEYFLVSGDSIDVIKLKGAR